MGQNFKGVILAGGTGSRFYPVTYHISKQLLPVFNKPMIYYPLSILMLAGIKEVLIITKPSERCLFERLMGDGSQFGIKLSYTVQEEPKGIPQALQLSEEFIDGENTVLILGDNLFYGNGISSLLKRAMDNLQGASLFGYRVKNPSSYGVVEINQFGNIIDLCEKPEKPRSNIAATGLYMFDCEAARKSKALKPSARGELEIIDLMKAYLREDKLDLNMFTRGFAWFDTGNPSDMLKAAQFVETIETTQSETIACLEEIAYSQGWISANALLEAANTYKNSEYGCYLSSILRADNNDNFIAKE